MTAPGIRAALRALTADGAPVRFVGGSVRDALLGRDVSDIDLGTPDPPTRVSELLENAGIRAVPTGIEHGTVTACSGDVRCEITTLRRDLRTDGRHAEVAFTADWRADAARRDFTINAMSCEPDGTLHDYFGGEADLKAGRVRFVGEPARRIAEDRLRLLRFFRFHAWYGQGAPEQGALAACQAAAASVAALSGERVRGEMFKLLAAPAPAPVLALMGEAGVLTQVLPEAGETGPLAALAAIETEAGLGADPLRRLASLLQGDGAAAVARRWRFSKAETARIALLTAPPAALTPGLDRAAQRRLLYGVGRAAFRDLVLLAWAADGADRPFRAMLETADLWENPALPVSGADALASGAEEGPAVGRLLAAVEAWWIGRDFAPGRAEALEKLAALVAAADRGDEPAGR